MADTTARTNKKVLAVVDRHADQRNSIMLALLKALLGLWSGFNYWSDRDMVEAYAAQSGVMVDTALLKTRRLARAYAKTILSTLDALPADGKLPDVDDVYPRSGTNEVKTYSRVAEQYLWRIKQGDAPEDAREWAEDRLTRMAETDVMLAERDETQRSFGKGKGVIGHRRVIHPELAKSGRSCGLCIVASDMLYKVAELMPVHDRCNCTDMVVTRDYDPGSILNADDLERLYAAGGGTYGRDLKDVRVSVNENGELGPILVRTGDHFTNVEELNKRSRRELTPFEKPTIEQQRTDWQAQVDDSKRALKRLKNKRDADPANAADYDTAIGYQQRLIDRFNTKLRASA